MAEPPTTSALGAARRPIPCVLSIAGSDSGGGAGIQADLKAFAACGVHGMTAITAITAQNTLGVTAIETVSPDLILAQVRAVADDIGVDGVKIGMLADVATIEAVARALDELGGRDRIPVVLDPVMVSESGAELLDPAARGALIEQLLPRAQVLTPNLPEARALAGYGSEPVGEVPAADEGQPGPGGGADAIEPEGDEAATLARALHRLGPRVVVVTGGHRRAASDVFFDGSRVVEIAGERHPGGAAHGSGCTHSSVLAARLAWGDSPLQAATIARRRAAEAVRDGLTSVGAGAGPVDVLGVT